MHARNWLCTSAGLLALALATTTHAQALSSAQAKCRNFIATKVRRVADTVLNEEIKCQSDHALGVSVDCSSPDAAGFPAMGKSRVARAVTGLDTIGSHCITPPNGDGYTTCPSPCNGTVPAITTYADLGHCLVCLAKAHASTLVTTAYGATPPILGTPSDTWTCQNRYVGKAARTYVKKRMGQLQRCQYSEDRNKIGATDCKNADLTGRIGIAAQKLSDSIGNCNDGELGMLTSCATAVATEKSCILAGASTMNDTLFDEIYPQPPAATATPTRTPSSSPTVSPTATDTPVTGSCTQAGNFLDVSSAPGAGAGYPTPSLSVSCSTNTVTVQSNGIPPYTYVAVTPNGLSAQNYNFTFPRSPAVAASTTTVPLLGNVAVAVNGMPIYGPNEAAMPDPYGDPVVNAILDECLGHTGQGGSYHYHALLVKCLIASGLVAQPWDNPDPPTDQPSPIVAYAFDGFPIYGPYECTDSGCSSVQAMLSSWDNTGYQAGTIGCASSSVCLSTNRCAPVMINGVMNTACVPKTCAWSNNDYVAKAGSEYLDQCNGHYGPNGDYHYHATPTFPYIIGCYRGTPTNNGGNGVPPGGTCP
jgi:YHYH protein